MSIDSKMTALADEIRELSGTSEAMGLDAMKANISETNNEVDSQAALIAQIANALEGKAVGGSAEQATPVISVNSSNGLVTATAGTKSSTHQLAFQSAKTITPSTVSQIAVSGGYYTGGNITVAGDSNLIAGNIKSGVSIFGVSGTLEAGSGGSGEQAEWSANEDAMVTGTLSSYFNDRVDTIGSYAFYSCPSLTTVSFPVCTDIGSYAFAGCPSLTTISFPVCTTIGSKAFDHCSNLTTVNFPSCRTIDNYAFDGCTSLTSASFPVCTDIGSYAFDTCRSLTTVSFPVCTVIDAYAFDHCSNLTTVNFPSCRTIDNYAFANCPSLTTVSFPVCNAIYHGAFANCSSLTTVSFPACSTIYGYTANGAFRQCVNLTKLYLTSYEVCILTGSSAFYETPIGGYSASARTYGSIYVPASLLTSYKTATNWTYFSSRFVGI